MKTMSYDYFNTTGDITNWALPYTYSSYYVPTYLCISQNLQIYSDTHIMYILCLFTLLCLLVLLLQGVGCIAIGAITEISSQTLSSKKE